MIIKSRRWVLNIGWLCIFLLPNHDLFNFVFSGTPLTIWKQALFSIMFGLAFRWSNQSGRVESADEVKKKIILILSAASVFFLLYSMALGLSATRVVYSLMSYFGLLGFLYFSSLVSCDKERFTVYKAIAILSVISSIGLLIDYFTRIFFFLPRASGIAIEYLDFHGITNRAAFLFGASTTVVQFQAFGLMVSALLCARRYSSLRFLLFMSVACLNLVSVYLTGSRSAFFIQVFFFFILFFVATSGRFGSLHRIFMLVSVVMIVFLGFDFRAFSIFEDNWERFSAVLSSQDEGNSHRFTRWLEGLSLMGTLTPEWFFGNGVGSTNGIIVDGFPTSTHFESSVLQAFFEGGFGLVFLRYYCALVAIWVFFSRSKKKTREQWALVIFLVVHFVSTAVAPTFGAYHTQMVYFLASGLLISLSLSSAGTEVRFFERSDGHNLRAV